MKRFKFSLFSLLVVSLLASCVKDNVERSSNYFTDEDVDVLSQHLNLDFENGAENYHVNLPNYVTAGTFGPTSFKLNRAKAQLGRVLFYDENLSENNAVSCASCHNQSKAFSDPVAFSDGLHGEKTLRNSYAIGSTASTRQYYQISRPTLFWDSRANTVTKQSTETLQNTIEMGMDLNKLTSKLNEIDYYKPLFKKAFGPNADINSQNALSAIEEFVLSFSSSNSKFDKAYIKHTSGFDPYRTNLDGFTDQEIQGKSLFMDNCASCHGQTFTLADIQVASNGLDKEYSDQGVGAISRKSSDQGVFKTAILRNVELTAPYMHDGRFATLEDVVNFYSEGIQDHPNLHPLLRSNDGSPKKFNFSEDEKQALVSFLKTLTDYEFIAEEKYSNPFIR